MYFRSDKQQYINIIAPDTIQNLPKCIITMNCITLRRRYFLMLSDNVILILKHS